MSDQEQNQAELAEEPIVEMENETGTGAEGAAEEGQSEPTVEEQLETAVSEAADYKDKWIRLQAEFANARKRMDKQRIQAYQNATAELAEKLLPAIDDFDRAIENVPEAIASDSWFEGIELVQKKLGGILERFDVEPIPAVGEPFDPNHHEAITAQPSDEHESGTVIQELQKGYKIGDRVIRPSLVIVAQ